MDKTLNQIATMQEILDKNDFTVLTLKYKQL